MSETLLGVIIGGFIAAGAGFLSSWWTDRREMIRWKREKRLQFLLTKNEKFSILLSELTNAQASLTALSVNQNHSNDRPQELLATVFGPINQLTSMNIEQPLKSEIEHFYDVIRKQTDAGTAVGFNTALTGVVTAVCLVIEQQLSEIDTLTSLD